MRSPNSSLSLHRTELPSSPAIRLETFPAVRWTFDSFSNLKATRSRRWKSFHEGWLQSRVLTGMNGRFAHPEPARADREFASLVSDPGLFKWRCSANYSL